MKSLIVDFHGGCISVLSGMIATSGRSKVEILAITDQTKILKANGYSELSLSDGKRKYYLRRLGIWNSLNLNQSKIKAAVKPSSFVGLYRNLVPSPPEYDLAWVSFPPALYQRVLDSRIARKVVVYVSHRADLWLSKTSERRKFWARFTKDITSGKVLAIASNEYDQQYVRFYTGLTIPLVKPVPHHALTENRLAKRSTFLLGPTNLNLDRPVISEVLSQVPNLISVRVQYSNFTFEDLSSHQGIVVLPYSIYSISLVEYEFLDIPIFIPSDRWLIENGFLDDVCLFPLYGNRREIQSYEGDRFINGPNSNEISTWLKFAYWKNTNNTFVWDSIEELQHLLATPTSSLKHDNSKELAESRQSDFNRVISELSDHQW